MPLVSGVQDKGWAWVVVCGAFISHFLTCGYEKGYSVLYAEIVEKFHTTAALAAGVGGFSASIRLLFAPISVWLCGLFNEQKVVFVGGILCFAGLLLSALCSEFYGVAIGYGLLFGFGLTLVYTPSLTICTTYFKVRRSTAISLSLSGCGFAALTIPYLIVYLIEEYMYSGALLVLAAISLHYSVAGSLYREFPIPQSTIKSSVNTEERQHANLEQSQIKRSISVRIRSISCSKYTSNPWLLLFLFSFCLNMMGSGPVTTMLIHHAENLGYKRMMSVQLLAIEGVVQIFVRIFTGFALDYPLIKPHRGLIWSLTIALSALIILLLAFASTLWVLSVLMGLRGITLAIYISQQAVITGDLCEHAPETLKQTIGLTQIGKGIGVLFGSWCAGAIKDYTQEYRWAFMFLSLMQFLGSLAAGCAVVNAMRYTRRIQARQHTSSKYSFVSTVSNTTVFSDNANSPTDGDKLQTIDDGDQLGIDSKYDEFPERDLTELHLNQESQLCDIQRQSSTSPLI